MSNKTNNLAVFWGWGGGGGGQSQRQVLCMTIMWSIPGNGNNLLLELLCLVQVQGEPVYQEPRAAFHLGHHSLVAKQIYSATHMIFSIDMSLLFRP